MEVGKLSLKSTSLRSSVLHLRKAQRGLGVGKVVSSTRVQSDSIASHRRYAQKMAALT